MGKVSTKTIQNVSKFFDSLPEEVKDKCALCNETLVHIVKTAEARTGAGTATRPIEALFLPLDELDIEYGKKVAWMLGDWKINVLRNKVTTGEFHKNCEIFKAAIKAAVKMGKRPTFAVMANRRIQMKNWKIKESGEIISVLVKRGEIVEDDSKEKTAYYLPKKV